MRTLRVSIALCSFVYAGAQGADWLNAGGDASHKGWQKRERYFTLENVSNLRLLWKLKLDNAARGSNSLAGPVMLGPIVTHRGIKELVFVAGASNALFAVDDDLGRLFWKRTIEVAAPLPPDSEGPCGGGLTAAPALEPDRKPPPAVEDDDYRTSLRPLYLLASDGRLHQISPATGEDTMPPLNFLPPGAHASPLTFSNGVVTTETLGGCNGVPNGSWSIGIDSRAVARHESTNANPAITAWEDRDHVQWTYETSPTGVTAYKEAHQKAWETPGMVQPKQPIVSAGVLFVLAGGDATTHATLYAFDARTGRPLYSSANAIGSSSGSSGLALANGHITFGTDDNVLYCFGFPIETF